MNEVMVIEGFEIERIEYQGQPVLSLPMVARLHQKQLRRVWENFKRNIERFVEGEDFFDLPQEIWSPLVSAKCGYQEPESGYQSESKGGHRGNMVFLTLSGYLQLATTFTDELSWKIRKVLVNSYFRLRELLALAGDMAALKAKAAQADKLKDMLIDAQVEIIRLTKTSIYVSRKRFSVEEMEKAKQMAAEGVSPGEIAIALNRPYPSIRNYFRTWGIPIPKMPPGGKPK